MANENEGTSAGVWLIFLAIIAVLCIFYPPILGFVIGFAWWAVPVALIMYVLGHRGRIF
jgi:hypothetical protein